MNNNLFYLIVCFLTISICAQPQSFNSQFSNSQSKAYALLDLGFSAKLLHLNTEGANTVVKREEVKKSPRSLDEILAKSKNKKIDKKLDIEITHKFHLIAGCFSNLNNAQRLVSNLNEKGHNSKIIGENDRGLYMVSFQSYTSKADAKRYQKALSNEGVSSWVKIH